MGGNECGGSRAYRIVILVLWAYGPSTRAIVYAMLLVILFYMFSNYLSLPIHATVVGTTGPASYRGLRAIGTLVVATGLLL